MSKVGDIVVGTSEDLYTYTGYGSVCQVVEVFEVFEEDRMMVEIMKSAPGHCPAERQYVVTPEYFELRTPAHPRISDEDFEKLFA